MQVKVSVTVPIYNAESYLRHCLDSLMAQTLREIEFILIDDGSTDNSGKICDEYALKDTRFRVFHKKNGGSASARQLGLEHIMGEYYTVCDADDWVEPNMYEELYFKAKTDDVDIVICDSLFEYPNGSNRLVLGLKTKLSREDFLRGLISGENMGSTWNKLIRVRILNKYNVSYELGINQGEDTLFLMKLISSPVSISYLPKPFYHYRRQLNGNTYTNCPTMKSFVQMTFLREWKRKKFPESEYGKELFLSDINYVFTALRISDMPKMEYKQILSQYIPYSNFVKYRIYSLKSCLVLISKMNYAIAKMIFKIVYRFFYK